MPLLLGSANLIRPGLRPNGPSDMASRHRLKSDRSSGAVHLSQVAGGSHRPTRGERISVRAHVWTNPACSWDGETSKLEKIFTSVLVQPHTGRPISLAPKGERASLYDPYLILSEHLPMTYDDGRGEA